ncbi:MAG: hypothetical protein CM15mP32_0520 [Flavobacteriaceae bacterium]|nr:MAG: hypothetical protein CM15mP32_0520 [Flavobacteriaceae bacterium]
MSITNEKVADAPKFKEVSAEIYSWFKGSDLAGYNSDRFDIPLLAEEMLRAEIDVDFKKHKSIDVQTIFHKMEQRTLLLHINFIVQKTLKMHTVLAQIPKRLLRCSKRKLIIMKTWRMTWTC